MDWVKSLLELLGRLIGPLAFFITGRKYEENKYDKETNKTLQKQRDNDIHSIKSADDFWVRYDDNDLS